MLLPFVALGVNQKGLAQAPTSLSDVVFEYKVYSPLGAHSTLMPNLWLKADGTYVTITDDVYRSGADFGPLDLSAGNWSYIQDSPTTGEILFTETPSSEFRLIYALTFSTPISGTMSNIQGQFYASGTFSIRPSQFGIGASNLSTRTLLTPGAATIAGFVIPGSESRFVLFRAIGPSLAGFGVTNTASGMGITVFNSTGQVGSSSDWSATSSTTAMYQNLFVMAGAFPLTPDKGDACIVMELPPGSYTALASSVAGGNALIEVYFLP